MKRRALISVSDKSGLEPFAESLEALDFEIVSTGGTAGYLKNGGVTVTDVSAITNFPEIMDGRVKTLHPAVHGGLLGRGGIDDAVMEDQGIGWIDLLVVNLYPFRETVARSDATYADAIENIDIGGPAMVRAAAKNHARVAVVVDPADYDSVALALREGALGFEDRRRLAQKAFAHVAAYDTAVSQYLAHAIAGNDEGLPEQLTLSYSKALALRYGENPHQKGAFYVSDNPPSGSLGAAQLLQGKPLSYNNLADADAAWECVRTFEDTSCVIVKHGNPCGVATADTTLDAYQRAFATDPTSAFGGIIALNRKLDAATAAEIIDKQFVEVILCTEADPGALEAVAKKKNVRLLALGDGRPAPGLTLRSISGGLLVQDEDRPDAPAEFEVVTARQPTDSELADLRFAWTVARFVKSNAIVFCKDLRTVGVGAGQMSRVISTKIAALKADEEGLTARGSVLASDAFFPFRDGVDAAASHGIAAIVQPGGSIRDEEVIAAANEHEIAMVFSGRRHFRH